MSFAEDVDDATRDYAAALLAAVALDEGVLDSGHRSVLVQTIECVEFDLEVSLHDEQFVIPIRLSGAEFILLIGSASNLKLLVGFVVPFIPEGVAKVL